VKSKRGFTLVELVVVIAVLAILAAIAIPVVSRIINTAVLNTAKSDARTLEEHMVLAMADIQVRNRSTYGESAADGTLTIGEVVTEQAISEACEPSLYNNREVIPVWDQTTSSVELMYVDDSTNVETGIVITSFVKLEATSTEKVSTLK
jgi:prepilin-type N-terminal cleavage/methylation domain-containing protein